MKKATLFALFVIALSGCTSTYFFNVTGDTLETARLKPHFHVERNSQWVVHARTSVFLGKPVDLKPTPRRRNLISLYDSLSQEFQQTFPAYSTSDESLQLGEALANASESGSELLFWPKLVTAENNLNTHRELVEGQSLNPSRAYGTDKAVFQILIYEVRTKTLIDVATIAGRSRVFASDDSTPSDLYRRAAMEYIRSITSHQMG